MPTERERPLGMMTPQQAREGLREVSEIAFEARYLHALNTVESRIATHFRGDSFTIGYAPPPLGGGDGWIDEAMVPHICDAAEEAGWVVTLHSSHIVFTAPEEGTGA